MRAVGFSEPIKRAELKKLLTNVVLDAGERQYCTGSEDSAVADFKKEFGERIGITVCGVFDDEEQFSPEYYFPYLRGKGVSSSEDITVEQHAARESYAGICDDMRLGVSLIFYLQNRISYMRLMNLEKLPARGTSVTLSALALNGTIMLPILKNETEKQKVKRAGVNRRKLLSAAREGDEDAIENLTLEDMDMYTTISRRIQEDDVFSLVDTYFMPWGVECDQYSVLGEITECSSTVNPLTEETVYIMTIVSNELEFELCINAADLFGEPAVGRRFKGIIWMQGYINFP